MKGPVPVSLTSACCAAPSFRCLQVYICMLCDQKFDRKVKYDDHVAAHDVSAAVTAAALHSHEAQQAEAAAAAAGPAPQSPPQRPLVLHGMQATFSFRCQYCIGNVIGFDTLRQFGSVTSQLSKRH